MMLQLLTSFTIVTYDHHIFVTQATGVVFKIIHLFQNLLIAGNTKGGSITVPLTSCLTGLESAV
jgi:hypothetical protein